MLLVFALVCFFLASLQVARAVALPALQRRQTFDRARAYGEENEERDIALRERIESAWRTFARLGRRLSPASLRDTADVRLVEAGVVDRFSTTDFFAAKTLLGGLGLVIGALTADQIGGKFVLGAAFAVIGFLTPDIMLALRRRSRRRRTLEALPDALDMLAVSVEAGLGFEGAVAKLCEHTEGPLVDGLRLALAEMQVGESRHSALRRFAERSGLREVQAFVSAVAQSEQLGSSMAQLLRVQATDARRRRHALAEERAMRTPVKMVFPTAVFIFPAVFIAILGPAVITLAKVL
jgi:tight adherence protein C